MWEWCGSGKGCLAAREVVCGRGVGVVRGA